MRNSQTAEQNLLLQSEPISNRCHLSQSCFRTVSIPLIEFMIIFIIKLTQHKLKNKNRIPFFRCCFISLLRFLLINSKKKKNMCVFTLEVLYKRTHSCAYTYYTNGNEIDANIVCSVNIESFVA